MRKRIVGCWMFLCLLHGAVFCQQKQLDSLENALSISRLDTIQINLLIQLSKGYLGKDKKRSFEFAQKAKQAGEKINIPKWKSAAFQCMARAWKAEGKDSLAQSECEKALNYARQSGTLIEISNSLGLLSSIIEKKNIQKVIPFLEEKIAIDKKIADPLRLSQSYLLLGDKCRTMAKNDLALEYFTLGYEVLIKAGMPEKTGRSLQGIAGQNYILGHYETAVKMLNEAIRLNKEQKDLIAVGDNYNLMGVIYRRKGPIDSAIFWYNQCINHFNNLHERGRTHYPLNNLGNIYQDLKQFDKALEFRRKSLQVYKETDQKSQMGNTYSSLALTYLDMKLWDKALQTMDSAYLLEKNYGAEWEARRLLFQTRQKVYEQMGKMDSSLLYYKKYISIRDSIYGKESTEKMEKLKVEFETHRKEQQIASLQQENALKNELTKKQELELQIAKLFQAKTASERIILEEKISTETAIRREKEKELALEKLKEKLIADQVVSEHQKQLILKKENQLADAELDREKLFKNILVLVAFLVLVGAILIISRIRISQQKSKIATLTRISRDLHDNIGSTLGSITVYSEMAKTMKTSKPEKLDEILVRIAKNSRESVDMMADIVWSLKPENEPLDKLILRLKNFVSDVFQENGIQVDFVVSPGIESLKTTPEQRTNVFLIAKEALHNASKYSKATAIAIHFEKEKRHLKMEISDNGMGFSEAEVQMSRNGSGLTNMKERAKELGGNLKINSLPGKGTQIQLEFPV